LPATVKDAANQTTINGYDAKGRLTSRADNVATTLYGYDANNNPTTVVENTSTNTWAYDAYNRVSSYRDTSGNLIQYRYDANGNITNLVYPGGKNVYYGFDSLNRMTNVTDWSGRKSSITYDLASHITSITRPNGSYRTISYDAAGQATNIWEQMGNTLPIAWFRYNWSPNTTMQWEFAAPQPHTNSPPTRTMTYDDDNRLASVDGNNVTVDSDGNLTSGPLTNDTFAAYAYDARNRLQNAGGVTNVYDAVNNRIGQTFGTNIISYVVNPNTKLPQVLMRIKNGVTNYYIYGAGLLYQVTETATATNTLTYHYDFRGSTIALSGDNGLVTDRMEYSAYGSATYRVGTNDTPFLFNGRYGVMTDPNGLLYMRSRYYSPFLCRFINPDPSGFAGGLNMYAYANGNPVSYLDPFGLNGLSTGDTAFSWASNIATGIDANGNPTYGPPTGDGGYGQWLLSGQNNTDLYTAAIQNAVSASLIALSLIIAPEESFVTEGGLEAGGEGMLAGSIRNVNPTGSTMNCVNCSIATDATLAGSPASALPGNPTSISILENTFGGTFQPVSGQMQIGSVLSQAGNGSRGIVFGESLSGDVGHVFNVMNNNGSIQFLDGQIGGGGLNNFNNFQNFQFLLTYPGNP